MLFLFSVRVADDTSAVVPQYYMLYLNIYGLQQYGQLNYSCPLCFLFCSVLQKIGRNSCCCLELG